jgi:hypothetical protein
MKKVKKPAEFQDSDPLDGIKAVGCLLIGVVILIAALYGLYLLTNHLRPPL